MDIEKEIIEIKEILNESTDRLNENTNKILNNMNKLHKHEEKINDNAEKIKTSSFAFELLSENSQNLTKINKRLIGVIVVLLLILSATIGYLVYVLNDTGTIKETTTQEISDVDTIENSNIMNGDMYGKSKTN